MNLGAKVKPKILKQEDIWADSITETVVQGWCIYKI
jgi:hypothetical protein